MNYYVVTIIIVSLDPLNNSTIISRLLIMNLSLNSILSDLLKITKVGNERQN